jgi:hypothetical protein
VAGGRHVGGLRHADELECEVAVRRSADGVATSRGNAAWTATRHGASSRLAAAALPTSSPVKVVRGGRINGDVERLPADTERRLEELKRAGIDGFDRSLIPRVEWL